MFFNLKNTFFREIEMCDASYIVKLRNNKTLNKFIHKKTITLLSQKNYIKEYFNQNLSKRTSYYFIIINKHKKQKCGSVRLILKEKNIFTWGSWILDHNKSFTAAIDTLLFVYSFYTKKNFTNCYFDVRKTNLKTISIHLKSGAKIIRETNEDYFFEMSKENAKKFCKKYKNLIIT